MGIDKSPIGHPHCSNPATYTGMFTPMRELFAGTPEARRSDGVIKVEMHFLPDIDVQYDVCKGKRYNRETLEFKYKAKTRYWP